MKKAILSATQACTVMPMSLMGMILAVWDKARDVSCVLKTVSGVPLVPPIPHTLTVL